MKLGLRKSENLTFGQCLNVNAQRSVLFITESHTRKLLSSIYLKKKENVTVQLGWQGKAQSHCNDWRFFQPGITLEIISIVAILFGRSNSDL